MTTESRLSGFSGTRPVEAAHAFDVDRVQRFLEMTLEGFHGPLEVRQFRGGQSNPTYLLTTPGSRYVLRRKPPGATLRTAHAVDREFRVTRALQAHGVPVAEPLAWCDDPAVMETPFYVMAFVDGRIFWDPTLPGCSRDERAALYGAMGDVLVSIHSVDIDAAGLSDFGRRGEYFRRQIARWSEQYRQTRTRDIPEMERLMAWLEVAPPPSSGRDVVIHGDFRLDNLVFAHDAPRVIAVIDWELSTIGDPLADISYQCSQWRLPHQSFGGLAGADLSALGIPGEGVYVERYLSRLRLPVPAAWDAYIAYNLFRFAAILDGVGRRALLGNASNPRAREMAELVEPIARAGWKIAKSLGA